MLLDISSSVEIFKSIIQQIIDPEKFDGKYFWLDMWSWTGWLAIAQHIQAYRNRFQDIRNIWMEQQESIVRTTMHLMTQIIPTSLETPKILKGDTTQDMSMYNQVSLFVDDRKLTHVSNENIPTCSIPLDGKNDPFFQNIIALDAFFAYKISEHTQWFPQKMSFYSDINKGRYESDFKSRFWLAELCEVNKKIYPEDNISSLEDVMNMQIFQNMYPDTIEIWDGTMLELTKVGKHLEHDKKILFRRWLRRRWSG